MVILPYVKLGTMPYGCARVRGKKEMPEEGDIIFIRENRDDKNIWSNPWIQVKVDHFHESCYFVSKI
jgi:hypothetical protein